MTHQFPFTIDINFNRVFVENLKLNAQNSILTLQKKEMNDKLEYLFNLFGLKMFLKFQVKSFIIKKRAKGKRNAKREVTTYSGSVFSLIGSPKFQ